MPNFYYNVRLVGKIVTKDISAEELYNIINEELSWDLSFWMYGDANGNDYDVEHEYSEFSVSTFEQVLRMISCHIKTATLYAYDDRVQFYKRYKYIPAINTWEIATAQIKFVPDTYSIPC